MKYPLKWALDNFSLIPRFWKKNTFTIKSLYLCSDVRFQYYFLTNAVSKISDFLIDPASMKTQAYMNVLTSQMQKPMQTSVLV